MINIDHMANTSGGTLPLCLWEYEPQLKKGDKLIFTAFGAGFTWGASYMIWGYDGSKFANIDDVLVNVRSGKDQYSRRGGRK